MTKRSPAASLKVLFIGNSFTARNDVPKLVSQLAEARGLAWEDQSSFGLDYAETLRIWRENFDRAVEEGRLPPGFDQHFVRLWRYYLMYCEGGFRGGGIDVAQVTLVK